MRKLLRKIIEILDGTPAVYGKKQRGQSTLELALVSPILVILLAGMVEIGWFARNYLILLEVTRVGARLGAVQQNQTDPNNWDNAGSIHPQAYYLGRDPVADYAIPEDTNPDATITRWSSMYRSCAFGDGQPGREGFYNIIVCNMLRSVDPLVFGEQGRDPTGTDPTIYPDDIVVSVFAIQSVNPNDIPTVGQRSDAVAFMSLPNDGLPQAVVVGRYPTNANECYELDTRDPFDWVKNDARDVNSSGAAKAPADRNDRDYMELPGADYGLSERQRGFSWFAIHQIEGTNCFGSEWSVDDVQELMNLRRFNLTADGRREYLPSAGMVLTEMWWQHEPISQFLGLSPVISPVFGMLGTDTVISVWAAFPLPQVEPKLVIN